MMFPMPELAEVEFYRKQWNKGIGDRITRVAVHSEKRVFRGTDALQMKRSLLGATLLRSEARGKQLLFCFSKDLWLGVHLGMTGKLLVEPPDFVPGKHHHLVLYQAARALVFQDARLFGRVRFHRGAAPPAWWSQLPPPVNSKEFQRSAMREFLRRHSRITIKAALLHQTGFPGVGNWMADEILWRAKLPPKWTAGNLTNEQESRLWKALRFVCRAAMQHVGEDFSDPPPGWLFHERWKRAGRCPLHKSPLKRETVGGRTTAWCEACQGAR